MKSTVIAFPLIALLAGSPVFAQEASPEPPATAPDAGLDLGRPMQDGPETFIRDTFEDWDLQCVAIAEGEEICQMYQLLDDGSGNPVAEASIFKLPEGGQAVAGGTFVAPLETLLTQRLTISVDGAQPRAYDFSFCNQIGCYARIGFTQEDVNRFRAGAVAQVSIVPAMAPDQRVTVEMSLSGFTAAFEEVSVLQP